MAAADRQRQRNNTIAGAFVLIALLSFVIIVLTLSNLGSVFGGTKVIEARFPLSIGVPGLEAGADVAVGMRPVGSVTEVRPVLNVEPAPPGNESTEPYISVLLRVPSDVEVTELTRAELVVPLLGSGSFINLGGVGEGSKLAAAGDGDDARPAVPGMFAPSIILQQAGISATELKKIRNTINQISTISDNLVSITDFVDDTLTNEGQTVLADVRGAVERFRGLADEIALKQGAWVRQVDEILANVETTTARGPELAEDADRLIANVQGGVDDVRGVISEVSPNVRQTTENVEAITTRFRNETLDELSSLLAQGETTLGRAADIAEQLDQTLTTELPQLSRILGNMRIASDNMKLAMIEIRAEPWRVLYEPSREEVRESLTNDIVRTYANAVSDLNAAVVSLKSLQDRYGSSLAPEDEALQRVLNELEQSFETYQEREAQWFERIIGANGTRPAAGLTSPPPISAAAGSDR